MSAREPLPDLPTGARLGPFEVGSPLGRGAQGVVYRARDTRDGATVALKVRRAHGRGATSTEAAEFRALTRVRHDRVVELRGVVEEDGLVGLALEFLPGGGLSVVLGSEPIAGARVEAYARDLLAGLAAVHAAGVVHRDLKPSNVLVDAHGRVKLSDFGIAREVREGEGTGVRQIEGSPPYMAPEVILGQEATARSDLFSLGVILHRALHGRPPFDGATEAEIWLAILNRPPERAVAAPAGAAPGLLDLIDRCLSKDPSRRPASCAEATDVLDGRAGPPPPEEGRVLVGREEEQARLDGWLDELARGRSGFVILNGAAGAGISSLIEATGERARRRGIAWVGVSVGPEGFLRPAVRAIVRALDAERASRSTETLDARRRLASDAGVLTESDQPAEVVRDVGILLRAFAGDRPFVLAVDALHEADADDLRRIEAVVRAITEGRGGAILGQRAGSTGEDRLAALGSDERARALDLGPLSAPHVIEILERQTGLRLDPAVAELIVARAGGNLRAASALLAHLRSAGAVALRGEMLVGEAGWRDAVVLPDDRAQVVAALARLDPEARRLVDAAAADGIEFDPIALAAVLGGDVRAVLRIARRLSDAEPALLVEVGGEFRFARADAREVALAAIEPAARARLDRALAEHLEARADPVETERIAKHWEGVGDFDRARPYLMRAAAEAARRYERSRFIDLCRRAGISEETLREPVTPELVELALRAIGYLAVLRRPSALERMATRLEAWAARAADDETRRRLAIRLAQGRAAERSLSAPEVASLRSAVERVRSPADASRGLITLSRFHLRNGEAQAAIRDAREGARMALLAGLPSIEATAWDQLSTALEEAGDVDEAAGALERAIGMCEAVGAHANAAISRIKRDRLLFDHELALPDLRRFGVEIDRVRSSGGVWPSIVARTELARIRRTLGDLRGGLIESRRGDDEARRSGRAKGYSESRIEISAALIGLGDFDAAAEMLASARAIDEGGESATHMRSLASIDSALACALGYVEAGRRGAESALVGVANGELSSDVLVATIVEGVLIADPADGAEVLDAVPEIARAAEESARLAPRALVAAARLILGRSPGPRDHEWLDAGLASSFIQENHLVASVATRWAMGVRRSLGGDETGAQVLFREARERALRSEHQSLASRVGPYATA